MLKITAVNGRIIDPSLIQNPKLRRVLDDRSRDFMFNYGDRGNGERSDYNESQRAYSDHTDRHSESGDGRICHTDEHTDS